MFAAAFSFSSRLYRRYRQSYRHSEDGHGPRRGDAVFSNDGQRVYAIGNTDNKQVLREIADIESHENIKTRLEEEALC